LVPDWLARERQLLHPLTVCGCEHPDTSRATYLSRHGPWPDRPRYRLRRAVLGSNFRRRSVARFTRCTRLSTV
jgi:hypothetical protein